MSNGAGRANLALGIAATLIAIAVIVVLGGLSWSGQHREHREQREAAATQHAEDAGERWQAACFRFAGFDIMFCSYEEPNAEAEQEYAASDLKAQQDMAEWAFAMFVTAAVGALITLAGVIYVAMTLHETRKMTAATAEATKVTREIGEAQVRCYPTITKVEMAFGGAERTDHTFCMADTKPTDAHPWMPKIFFEVENGGQSPALSVHWAPSVKYLAHDFENNRHLQRLGPRNFPMPDAVKTARFGETIPATSSKKFSGDVHIFPTDEEVRALTRTDQNGALAITIVISLCYQDVFKNVIAEDYCFSSGMTGASAGDRFPFEPVPLFQFEPQERVILSVQRPTAGAAEKGSE